MKRLFKHSAGLMFCLIISVQIYAQSEGLGRLSGGVVFSPDYAYRVIKFQDEFKPWKEQLDNIEHPIFGYTTGISLLYRLNNKSELESGLLFATKGYVYKVPGEEGWQIPDSELSDGWDINDPALPLEATTTYNFRYLDVPLKINWFFLQKKVRLFLSSGVSVGLFLDEFMVQKATFTDRSETSRFNEEDVDFNAVTLSLTGGAGIEWPLSERVHIRLNPEFRHAVTPVADIPGKYYLWSVGVNTGIFFKLQK